MTAKPTHPRFIDLEGQTFGRLVVVSYVGRDSLRTLWNCLCSCGNEKVISTIGLRHSRTQSCGCYHWERFHASHTTHGMCDTPTYHTWAAMIQRCTNPKTENYARYGGRGITVCESWLKFDAFFADMGERPKGKTLDRKDNDKGYSPENCRWATDHEQRRNTGRTRMITWSGKTQTAKEWAAELQIAYSTLISRLRMGWSVDEAFGVVSRDGK